MEETNKKPDELAGEPEGAKPEGEGQANGVKKPQKTIDYKAEYERLEEEVKAQRKKFAVLEKERRQKKQDEDNEDADIDDKKDIDDRIKQAVSEEIAGIRKEISKPQAELIVSQLTSNADEQKLILWYYENRITPSGNLREDLENAKLLANKKRILAESSEMQRALNSKENKAGDTGSGQKLPSKAPEPTPSVEDQAVIAKLKQQGYKWDGQKYVHPKRKNIFWQPGS